MVALEISTQRRSSKHQPGNASVDPTFESRECPVERRNNPWTFGATRFRSTLPRHHQEVYGQASGRNGQVPNVVDLSAKSPATAGSDAFWSTAQLSVPCFSGGQARVFKFLGIWGPSCTSNHAKEEIYDKRQSCSRDSSSGSRGAGPGCTFAGAEQTCNLRRNRQSLWS